MAPRGLGELKFRVRFDKRTEDSSDPAGGTLTTWVTQFTRWAAIEPQIGREDVMAQRLVGVQPILIFVRDDSQTRLIDPSWRAVEMRDTTPYRYYALKTAEDMERVRKYITFVAIAGLADA